MEISDRIKTIRGDLTQEEFATRIEIKKNTVGRLERGEQVPDLSELNKILAVYPDISPAWLLADEGPMKRGEVKQSANGTGIIQGDGNKLHVDIHREHPMRRVSDRVSEPGVEYSADPITEAFVRDWKSLSDVGKMRVWTMLKEEIEREKVKG